jgi:methylenetetrahydrofolate dehydrogenase (NADP+)/methenyltetrahydrofolate cyclohydrolase
MRRFIFQPSCLLSNLSFFKDLPFLPLNLMWRLSSATLRERRTPSTNRAVSLLKGKRFKHALALQLDYYMSPQFAGVASALVNNSYGSKGIDISFLPICPVGLEQANVRKYQDANPSAVAMGTVEQNIFIPTLAANPGLKTTAVATMFSKSPLCIASLTHPNDGKLKIGTHEDTVDIMTRIFPSHEVFASPRATKNTDLLSGGLGAIQAYTTTEVPALRRALGHDPVVTPLEGLNGTKLGYSQVVFTADECLHGDQRAVVQAFCEATFEGWANAIRNPEQAAEMVNEAKKILGLDDEANDHWHPSSEFDAEMLQNCNDYVKGTFQGDRYGVINVARWNEANDWLLKGTRRGSNEFGLDADVWQPPKNLLAGNSLARTILEDAKASATFFQQTYGRKPSLSVITVGDLERYKHGQRRLQLYSNSSSSWFSKVSTGEANGFDVKAINLDASTTTDELLSEIYALRNVDGIQLMWPLPDHIDTARVYSAIDVSKDVDGIHYVGQLEIGNKDAYPPVTPAAAMALMKEFNVEVEGKRVLVIGRSPIVGSPIAHMVRQKGAAVTVAHSSVQEETLKKLVGEAEVIITCAGLSGLVKAEWIKGAEVVNVGTTFQEDLDCLVSDVDGDIAKYASRYSPVPGGIGPLSAPILFKNVAKAAWDQMSTTGVVLDGGWNRHPASLRKNYHFDSYSEALVAAKKIDELSTIMDHHANMSFTHKCVSGCELEMEFFTFEANQITEKDYDAAQAVDMILSKDKVEMSKYSYNLREENIAKYPASPRGSSKLLKCDGPGNVSYYDNFSEVFPSLAKGCHIVFNDSRVLDARLFIKDASSSKVELMVLDLGSVDVAGACEDTVLQAMIRADNVQVGATFEEYGGNGIIEVVGIKG